MDESPLNLKTLLPDEWRVLRAARLKALLDSPHAFTSSYEHEFGWEEPDWRRLFDDATWIVAREARNLIGLVRSARERERPTARHIESAWVAPTHRLRGVFRTLLHALAEMDGREGVTDLMLWVLEDNHEAQGAYEALGFEATGERQLLQDCGRFELRLRLCIKAPPLVGRDGAIEQDGRGHPDHLIHVMLPAHADDVPARLLTAREEAATREPKVVKGNLVPTA
jgi:ribosomal protein S18 acetylase RimI-like enzyme